MLKFYTTISNTIRHSSLVATKCAALAIAIFALTGIANGQRNLAIGKITKQSSTYGSGGDSSRAVDGIRNGNFFRKSVTHTNEQKGAWWYVDLGAIYNISEIRIYNRTDCCLDRLKDFRIVVSDRLPSSTVRGTPFGYIQSTKTSPIILKNNKRGRYITIYKNTRGILSLAEVEVYGTPVSLNTGTSRVRTRPTPRPRITPKPRVNSVASNARSRAYREQQCFSMVQGKVAYNRQGNKRWNPVNIRRLCSQTKNPAGTVACFRSEFTKINDWARAVQICQNRFRNAVSNSSSRTKSIDQNSRVNSNSILQKFDLRDAYFVVESDDDGSTTPAIFGTVNLRLFKDGREIRRWQLFSRSSRAGSRVIARENQRISLKLRDSISIPQNELSRHSLRLDIRLSDYDASSSNDLLGNTSIIKRLDQVGSRIVEVAKVLTGEGRVRVGYSVSGLKAGQFPVRVNSQLGVSFSDRNAPESWLLRLTKGWMRFLPDNTLVENISIPGTHDSAATYSPTPFEASWTIAQSWTVKEQLDAGIRYLDIRVRRTGTSFAIHHGPVFQRKMFGDVLNQVSAFLRANPTETVVMRLKDEHTAQDGSSSFEEIYKSYASRYGGLIYSPTNAHPKLGEVRGKIFLLCNDKCNSNGTMFSQATLQDKYEVASDRELREKIRLINQNFAKASRSTNGWYLNHLSATGLNANELGSAGAFFGKKLFTISQIAKSTNRYFNQELKRYENVNRKLKAGVIIADFPGEDLIYRIIKTNFAK
ncbi:MAG: phosphatidylinositol-specific phospholipase C domain-containing protein [Pyrinomonadaceae bacterium]|nr:phosphatidylinositol-specific phospholipase C domain-containing protein [Pyrinomonadaceae bacterium]